MALYDNQHWLLCHIRDSFLSTDDTGMCEMVMLGEDIPAQLKENGTLQCYPGIEESDEEDLDGLAESYDIQMDMEFSHRQRSNTAQRLVEMDIERKQAARVKHIKWENNSNSISVSEQLELFQRKDFRNVNANNKKRCSLLSEQLEKCPNLPQNPFTEYAKFDGSDQVGTPIRKYRIFMCMLPKEQRTYPIQVTVVTSAKVQEFIGLICYKYANEHPDHIRKEDIKKYGLYITEDDGEVDWDFPCLDPRETISKFEFTTLGLVEMKQSDRTRHNAENQIEIKDEVNIENDHREQEVAEDLARMEVHTTAMEAPLYQSYRVYIINRVRTKTEIHLGISGEKIEIDPVLTGKGAGRFWSKQRAVSYHIDNIAWCEITETKGSKTIFTLVYTPHSSASDNIIVSSSHSHSLHQSASFKNHDFETDSITAEEIVRKINHILELHSSKARREYVAQKERKASRRKSFHLYR